MARGTLRNLKNEHLFFVNTWELDTQRDKVAYECTDSSVVDDDLEKLQVASLSLLGRMTNNIIID